MTLDNFYQSKQWERLSQQLRLERVNEDGLLICERCGKPIVKAYDAIAHHTIPLTEETVNDFSVSLNPELIQLVHHRCHNYIHNNLGYKRREVYLVYGSPCSGKNTYVDSVMEPGDLLIDIDKIKQALTNRGTHVLVPGLNPIVFGIRDYLYDSVKVQRGRWNNCYIVGGFPLIGERERICRALGAREVYVDTPKDVCLQRLRENPDGRDVEAWTGYIEQWWSRFRPTVE